MALLIPAALALGVVCLAFVLMLAALVALPLVVGPLAVLVGVALTENVGEQ